MAFVKLEAPMPDLEFPRLMLGVPNTIMTVEGNCTTRPLDRSPSC
jgi:hypothetical protein